MNDIYPWNEKHLDSDGSNSDLAKGIAALALLIAAIAELVDKSKNSDDKRRD
ncbi:MAG: hypothetical protein IKI58_10585 [Oscillospiraceae bacterium]|nr:hypothetical protein [Oscillospiraceae bacterium]